MLIPYLIFQNQCNEGLISRPFFYLIITNKINIFTPKGFKAE